MKKTPETSPLSWLLLRGGDEGEFGDLDSRFHGCVTITVHPGIQKNPVVFRGSGTKPGKCFHNREFLGECK